MLLDFERQMNESASVTSSSLAIAEKRHRRAGGCVGIFFQLFDWNRRFAKKTLFSKQLLPPDRAKEASKKFGSDEKLPKLRLIADENTGGFPNVNKNGVSIVKSGSGKNGVQTPSLVARLMGLESMPSVQQNKLLKDSSGEFRGGRREKVVGENDEIEKETTRQEFRPQKLQKTGMVERRTVTRFGAEALQLKNVLSRSKKHHHPKLASPVKNASHHTKRNTSRLIGAATRILEPGLQARNKSKYAITYAQSTQKLESVKGENLDLSGRSNRCTNTTVLSCKNCGNWRYIAESTSSVNPSQVSPNGNSRYACSSVDQEHKFSTNAVTVTIDHGRHVHQQSQPQNSASSTYVNENNRNLVDNGVSSYSKLNCLPINRDTVSDTKDFVALNRSLSGRTRSRVPVKIEDTKFDKRSNNCLSPGQKRHFTCIRKHGEANNRPTVVSSNHYQGQCSRVRGRGRGRGGSGGGGGGGGSSCGGGSNNNGDRMAFKFSSPTKNRCEVPTKVEKRRTPNASTCKTTSTKKFTSNQSDEKICLQKPFPLTGDSLGALIEEKLHELTSQVEYQSGQNVNLPKRTPANIFQELICALNMERRPVFQNDMKFSPRKNHLQHRIRSTYDDHNTRFCLQKNSEKAGALTGHGDHFSTGSVLEASFSNDSCCSSSLEDSSTRTQHADSMTYSYDESQCLDSETDPIYSHFELVTDLLTYISQVLCSIDLLINSKINGNKRAHVKETIFNTELVLSHQKDFNPNKTNSLPVCHLLLELDILVGVIWSRCGNFLGSRGYQLKWFLFDFLIEYLDSKYGQYSKCGFRVWTSLSIPPCISFDILIFEVVTEVRKWIGFIGVTSDELVERDMSHSLGKWMDFEIEAYETGAKIEGDILQMLVDEIVFDLPIGISCVFRV